MMMKCSGSTRQEISDFIVTVTIDHCGDTCWGHGEERIQGYRWDHQTV